MSAINDLTNVIREISDAFGKLRRPDLVNVGKEAIRLITIRTRLGYGVDKPRDKRKKLKGLSFGYTEYRKKNRSQLSEFTRPTRSNLTFTGKMLGSMRITAVSARQGMVAVGPNNRKRSEGPTNKEVAEFQEKAGRIFNNPSDLEVKKLARFYKLALVKAVDRNRK